MIYKNRDFAYKAFLKTDQFNCRKKYVREKINFSEYSGMYTFTTENLQGYLSKLNIQDKNVLTVTSSGDQLINLCLMGAKKIDCFDINRNSYYMTELKIAALRALRYEEFLCFFATHGLQLKTNKYCFSLAIYKKIRPFLSDDVAFYFDLLYKKYKSLSSEKILIASNMSDAIKNNVYLKDSMSYNKAKSKIINLNYNYNFCDVFELTKLDNKYDIILLSNIYDYLPDKNYFFNYISSDLKNNLNEYGVIALSYQYHYKKLSLYFNTLENLNLDKIIVNNAISSVNKDTNDCVYIYKKGVKLWKN